MNIRKLIIGTSLMVLSLILVNKARSIRPSGDIVNPESNELRPKDSTGTILIRSASNGTVGSSAFDESRRWTDRRYADAVHRFLVRQDARRLLKRPDVGEAASEIFRLIEGRFGSEIALRQLRQTYSELAGIGQFKENLDRLELEPRNATPKVRLSLAEMTPSEYESRKRYYVALATKLEMASRARLEQELPFLAADFFPLLYAIKPEVALPQFDNRIEPGTPLADKD